MDSPPPSAERALQVLVARLRSAIGGAGHVIERTGGGYRLDGAPEDVDAGWLCAVARRAKIAPSDLEEALALWRGDPFGEFAEEAPLRGAVNELRSAYARLTAALHEAALNDGDAASALPAMARWADDHPDDEAAWSRYAIALDGVGHTAHALRVLHSFRMRLRAVSGLDPSADMVELEQTLLGHPSPPVMRQHGGPPLTLRRLIGREHEVTELCDVVRKRQLVSVVGTGGVGKSRLALTVTQQLESAFCDGAAWCDLSVVVAPSDVVSVVAATLGVEPQPGRTLAGAVAHAIGSRQMLVVLDNCEHVIEGCRELLVNLLDGHDGVHVVATSRRPLAVDGEFVRRLEPLPVYDGAGRPGPAVELFRTVAADCGDPIADDTATAHVVAALCGRLDGLPLAIELAAARTTVLSPFEIAQRLDDSLALLASPGTAPRSLSRHPSLQAAIQFSYGLLEEDERILFDRLGVFPGSFGLDAVEAICTMSPIARHDVLDLLHRLVDHSLVVVLDSGVGKRYRLLDSLHRFARDRLDGAGNGEVLSDRHAVWYTSVATEFEEASRGAGNLIAIEGVERELPNLRAAFEQHLLAGRIDDAQCIACSTWVTLLYADTTWALQTWASRTLALAPDHVGPHTARSRAMAGWAAVYRSDFNEAWELAESGLAAGEAGSIDDGSVANLIGVLPTLSRHGQERARDIMDREVTRARTSGQTERLARALAYRVFARRHDDIDGRLADAGEAVALTNTLGNLSLAAFAHSQAAWSLHRAGDPSAAELARETARLASASRNTIMSAYSSHLLGTIAIEQRRYCDAMAHLTDALRTWRRAADARSWGAVHQIAELLTDTGHGEAALTLFAAIGNRNLGVAIYLRPDAIERAAALADHDTATRSRLRGALLDEDGAIEVALAAAAEMIAGSTVSTTPAHLAPTDPCDKPALPAPASDAHKQQPH